MENEEQNVNVEKSEQEEECVTLEDANNKLKKLREERGKLSVVAPVATLIIVDLVFGGTGITFISCHRYATRWEGACLYSGIGMLAFALLIMVICIYVLIDKVRQKSKLSETIEQTKEKIDQLLRQPSETSPTIQQDKKEIVQNCDLQTRLVELKNAYEQGLITEEEYKHAREKVLGL